jgi:hypothetical protein
MLVAFLFLLACTQVHTQRDPLASWNDGKSKPSVIDFVKRVTAKSGKDSVPFAERIAVFDNDGALRADLRVRQFGGSTRRSTTPTRKAGRLRT